MDRRIAMLHTGNHGWAAWLLPHHANISREAHLAFVRMLGAWIQKKEGKEEGIIIDALVGFVFLHTHTSSILHASTRRFGGF